MVLELSAVAVRISAEVFGDHALCVFQSMLSAFHSFWPCWCFGVFLWGLRELGQKAFYLLLIVVFLFGWLDDLIVYCLVGYSWCIILLALWRICDLACAMIKVWRGSQSGRGFPRYGEE